MEKSRKSQGEEGYDKHFLQWKFQEGKGLKQKYIPLGGRCTDIFWNCIHHAVQIMTEIKWALLLYFN